MVSEYRFTCNQCDKDFVVKGYGYNQMVMHHYLDYKFLWHCIMQHRNGKSKKYILHLIKNTIIWVPLLMMQVLAIIAEPFRRL